MTTTEAKATDRDRVLALADELLAEHPPASTDRAEFLGAQFDKGLAWVHFSEGNGGLGLSPGLQSEIQLDLGRHGAPSSVARNPIGHGMGAPTVVHARSRRAEGSATCARCSPARRSGASCSREPGAGSRRRRPVDQGRARRRRVDRQRAEGVDHARATSRASACSLARTDPEAPKHRGMTYFVIDMHQPGVEVRPLRQMTGEAEFNEVYFTDVRIPDAERLGDVGRRLARGAHHAHERARLDRRRRSRRGAAG